MSQLTLKKSREKWLLTAALDRMGLSDHASGLVSYESPDFILPIGDRSTGVEVIEFFYPAEDVRAPSQFQILRNKSVEMARCKFRANGGPPLYVTPVFLDIPNPLGPQNKRDMENFADRFQSAVARNGWGVSQYDDRVFRLPRDLPELDFYFVLPGLSEEDELWAPAGPLNGVYIEPRHVQAVIDDKASKHANYAQNCDAVWLLIVNEGPLRTAPCEIGEDARNATYSFPFERAYWFDRFPTGELVRLSKSDRQHGLVPP